MSDRAPFPGQAELEALRAKGKHLRTPDEATRYRQLMAARSSHFGKERYKRLKAAAEARSVAAGSSSDPQDAQGADARPDERPSLGPLPGEQSERPSGSAETDGGAVPGEAGDDGADHSDDDRASFPREPDPPEAIEKRKSEARDLLSEGLGEWAGWIKGTRTWTPPPLVQRWLSRLGATAAEGYGIFDHEPPPHWAAIGFTVGMLVAFVPVSILALRRQYRDAASVEAHGEAVEEELPDIGDQGVDVDGDAEGYWT